MNSDVEIFLKGLEHSRKKDILHLTEKIAATFPKFESEIKWNAPSFKSKGTNIVTFQLFPDPAFRIILHIGAKKLTTPTDFRFEISQLVHKWADKTRCVITVEDDLNWQALKLTIKEWEKRVAL
jgi:hypothetical protein